MDSLQEAMVLYLLLIFGIQMCGLIEMAASQPSQALPGCREKCGDITVPYPFGTADGCSRDAGLLLSCDTTFQPPRLLLSLPTETQPLRVTNISAEFLTVSYTKIAQECNPSSISSNPNFTTFLLPDGPYTLSAAHNKLTLIGCDSLAVYQTSTGVLTACASFCRNTSVNANNTCSPSEGCCQSPIDRGSKTVSILVSSVLKHTTTRNLSNCSVAFPAQQDWYRFNFAQLARFPWAEVPVALEWAVGNEPCAEARRSARFACVGGNSTCVDSENGQAYRCRCMDGYEGNPYLKPGCVDIDECKDPNTHICSDICINTPGNYTCACPKGTHGDGLKNGKGCIKNSSKFPLAAQITLGVGLGVMAIVVTIGLLYWLRKKREYILLKKKYFEKNGGMLLQQKMSRGEDMARIFSEEELKVATAGFNESRVLGAGGFGTVYKGFLPDNRVVAIKKARAMDQTHLEQFLNEFILLSKVIHRNVVKILGCCLETEMPMLVYEYIPNGTLSDHMHSAQPSRLSWAKRLRIAADTAGAIAYLHSDLSRPIIHRDIKSANILLDRNFTAKVADFGASRLAPMSEAEFGTMVQGTLGYLDPEYVHTGHLTDRSDVYSFGVVLAELLTGQKSMSFTRVPELRTLATYFLAILKEDRLLEILDPAVKNGGGAALQQVVEVAQVTRRCLGMRADERPSMKEVAAELDRLRGFGGGPSMMQPEEDGDEIHDGRISNRVVPLSGGSTDGGQDYSVARDVYWTMDLER